MPRKSLSKAMLACLFVVLAYLTMAAAWAWMVFDDAIASAPPAAGNPLSDWQTATLLHVEDPTFHEHVGLSVAQGQGLATVSSAVARDLYLYHAKLEGTAGLLQRFYRGVFECCKKVDLGRDVMALVVNARLSKERQLAFYVSQIYMGTNEGRQIRGLEQAAASYLKKPLGQVTSREFIGLVASIKAPNHYHPGKNPAAHVERTRRIEALVSRKCQPDGWFDTSYEQCGP